MCHEEPIDFFLKRLHARFGLSGNASLQARHGMCSYDPNVGSASSKNQFLELSGIAAQSGRACFSSQPAVSRLERACPGWRIQITT